MSKAKELGSFVLRSEALKLYRTCLRVSRLAPAESRGELVQYIRDGFAIHRSKVEPYDIKYALSDGRTQLKKWQEMLDMRQ